MDKICIFCKEWTLYQGSYGYSDMTPGWEGSVCCTKNYWTLSLYEDTEESYRQKLLMAGSCKDYSEVEFQK